MTVLIGTMRVLIWPMRVHFGALRELIWAARGFISGGLGLTAENAKNTKRHRPALFFSAFFAFFVVKKVKRQPNLRKSAFISFKAGCKRWKS